MRSQGGKKPYLYFPSALHGKLSEQYSNRAMMKRFNTSSKEILDFMYVCFVLPACQTLEVTMQMQHHALPHNQVPSESVEPVLDQMKIRLRVVV